MNKTVAELYDNYRVNAKRVSTDVFFFDPETHCRFEGLIDRTMRFITDFQLTDPVHWARFVEQFKVHSDSKNLGWKPMLLS